MHPGSFLLVILLAILGQCQQDRMTQELQILKEIFQNETAYDADDGCDAVIGDIDSCVDCYPCDHEIVLTVPNYKEIKIRTGTVCPGATYLKLCCVSKGTESESPPNLLPRYTENESCGIRQRVGVGTRFGLEQMEDTIFGEYPWVVAIMGDCNSHGWEFQCVGTLINRRAVLTAAHCVCGTARWKCSFRVRAGEYQFSSTLERFPHVEVAVETVITHENYYAPALHNDIALLILKEPIEPMPHIGFACLADTNMKPGLGENCILAGWGKDGKGRRRAVRPRDVMRMIKMSPYDREKCENDLRCSSFGPDFKLHESFRCAVGIKGHICTGDGGAALVCPLKGESDRFVQYGIVALGQEDGTPSLFVDTTKFRDWIDRKVEQNINDIMTDSYLI